MDNNIIKEMMTSKNKNEVLDKYNVLFMYILNGTLNIPKRVVYVTNDNLHLINDMDKELVFSINTDSLNNVLSKYEQSIKECTDISVPTTYVLDGYVNEFYFKVNNTWYHDSISNLGYYDEEVVKENKHLSTVFDLLDDVYDVIHEQNKEMEKYFVLYEK